MKDNELRGIALREFYNDRRRGVRIWNEYDVPKEIEAGDFFAVCGQLAEHGLIDWHPHGKNGERGGRGNIKAAGIDVVEGKVQAPIAINIAGDLNNVQVGNSNSFSTLINVEKVNAAIDQSHFSAAEKAEAKDLLSRFLAHPLVTSIAGGIAGGLATRTTQ